MGTPAFNPNGSYSVPAFDPTASYQAEAGQSAPAAAPAQEPGYGEGLKAGLEGLYNAARHPIDTITAMGKQVMAGGSTPYGTPLTAPTGNQQRDQANEAAQLSAQNDAAQQGQFMGQHPAYTAGMLTPTAVLTAAGAAAPRLVPAIARGAGRALLLGKTPEAAYESALKPSITLSPAERAGAVQTGLSNEIPVSANGLKQIGGLIDRLNEDIKDTIAADPNKPIDPNAVAARANQVVPRFANQVNANGDVAAIRASQQQFLDEQGAQPAVAPKPTGLLDARGKPIMTQGTPAQPAPPMGAADAQAMKQGTYRVLAGKFGEQGSAAVEAQKALARGLKEEIATQFPEINNLNAQESKLLDLQPILERAVNRTANHQLIGIGTPVASAAAKAVTGSGSVGVVAGVLKSVLDNPVVKSRLAISVSKGAGIPYAQALARVGAYSSSLGSYAGTTQAASADQSAAQ